MDAMVIIMWSGTNWVMVLLCMEVMLRLRRHLRRRYALTAMLKMKWKLVLVRQLRVCVGWLW